MRRVLVVAGQLRFRSRLVDKKKLGNGDMAGPSYELWRLWCSADLRVLPMGAAMTLDLHRWGRIHMYR